MSRFETRRQKGAIGALDLLQRAVRQQHVDQGWRGRRSSDIDNGSGDRARRQIEIQFRRAVVTPLHVDVLQRSFQVLRVGAYLDLIPRVVLWRWQRRQKS